MIAKVNEVHTPNVQTEAHSESQSQIYRLFEETGKYNGFHAKSMPGNYGDVSANDILRTYDEVNQKFPEVQNPDVTPFYSPKDGSPLYVASFTSNSGTVTSLIIELQHHLKKEKGVSPFEVVYLFTDTNKPNGINPFFDKSHSFADLSVEYDIPIRVSDIDEYYQALGYQSKKDPRLTKQKKLELRRQFEMETIEDMERLPTPINGVVLDYYWSLCTPVITDRYLTINSHVGDLSVTDETGNRLLTGFHPVRRAIFMGHDDVYSTTHIADSEVDHGELLVRSRPFHMNLPEDTRRLGLQPPHLAEREYLMKPDKVGDVILMENWYEAQMLLNCDSQVLPLTLLLMSEGRFAKDENGRAYFNGHLLDPVLRL